MTCRVDRRSFMQQSAIAGVAMTGTSVATTEIRSMEEKRLLAMLENPSDKEDLKTDSSDSKIPMGQIGDLKISRIIGGGNVISGWCHQRDLLYVSTLAGHYLTQEKQFDTLELMEEQGINTCSPDPTQMDFINKYKEERGGVIQTIVGVRQEWEHMGKPFWSGMKEWIDRSIDDGATTIYTQGGFTEHALKTGNPDYIDVIGNAISYIKKQGLQAGLGAHDTKTIEISDVQGFDPDYYFKTFHHDKYWSALPHGSREHWSVDAKLHLDHNKFHDNMFDLFPDKTQKLMATKKKPWIAFKTLAAGAIDPLSAFEFCFKNGADFLAVGMFDFQILEDCIATQKVLAMKDVQNRTRQWFG